MVTVDEKVSNDEAEGTQGGNELSKLFLVCQAKQHKEKQKNEAKTVLTNGRQTNRRFLCRN